MLMRNVLSMNVAPEGGKRSAIDVEVKRVACSRNASRNTEATNAALSKVRDRGYRVHDAAGICFRSRYLLTNEDTIEVQGPHTSGEVEFVAIRHGGVLYASVGSDHNDRSLGELWAAALGKVYDSAKSKQMVPAVVARDAWLYDEVSAHWDAILLRSSVTVSGSRMPYQEFPLRELIDLEYYLEKYPWMSEDGSVLFGGSARILDSVPKHVYQGQRAFDGVSFPLDFSFEIHDPVLGRTISHAYTVRCLEEPDSLSL